MREVVKDLNVSHSMVIWHLKQIERWKSSISGCLMSWPKIKKMAKCHLLLFFATINHFSIRLLCAMKSGFYTTTSSVVVPRRSSKALYKAKVAPKKGSWSLFDDLPPIWSTTAFWILVKPLHLRSKLSRSMSCIQNYNACCWQWSTEWAPFFSMTTPNHMSHNRKLLVVWHTASKVEQIGPQSFASSTVFTWPPTNQLPLLQASWQLFQGEHFHNQQGAGKNAFQESIESWSTDFYTTGINKLISHRQKCVDCNGPYFD